MAYPHHVLRMSRGSKELDKAGPSGTHPRPETSQLARIITINMPEQKALYLTERFGAFAVGNAPIYAPGPGKLLIKVESAGLNTADWSIQAYGILIKEYPTILGMDVAGTVAKVGEGVTTFKEGDRVYVRALHRYMVLMAAPAASFRGTLAGVITLASSSTC